jgi:hypothetical protein
VEVRRTVTELRDLWTTPFGGEIAWELIDAFLDLGVREHEQLEYREQVDAGGERDRFVETVAAMANTGGVGIILIGVREDAKTDRPQEGWLLKPGALRPQSLEARCRVLQPYVPLEIAWASKPGLGQVVAVRVPDFWDRPVFVPDRGVLVRQGQSNVPASLDQLRWWLAPSSAGTVAQGSDYGFTGYFLSGSSTDARLNLGITASRPWQRWRWDDASDAALEQAAARWYPDLRETRIGESLVQFSAAGESLEARSFIRCFPNGAVLRHVDGVMVAAGTGICDMQLLANELIRFWQFGQTAVPAVLSEYRGPLTVWVAISGFPDGLWFPSRPRGMPRQAVSPVSYWTKTWPDVTPVTPTIEVVASLLAGLARAFGYRRVTDAIRETAKNASMASGIPESHPA